MDPITGASLGILMRWIHIISVITAIGGLLYSSLVIAPALSSLAAETRPAFAAAVNDRFRPLLRLSIFMLIVSGIYNLVTKANLPPGYHMFGIKMLLALHVIAVSFLLSSSSITQERRTRMTTGVVISGGIIVLLSAYLRFLTNWMQS